MQNEPKFQKVKLNVNNVLTKNYDQMDTWSIRKNEPKTNPKQTQPVVSLSNLFKPKQTQFLYHWFCFLFTIASKCRKFDKEFSIWLPIILLFKSV
jgi:hypothetical protein